jgi:hypothetical protein
MKMNLSKITKIQLMMIRAMLNQQQMTATMEILLEHAKNIFWVVNFVFIK